ncbi:MAG: hypothetical protein ACFFD8_04190 [Candidatus Thorarchaeota archaeon]
MPADNEKKTFDWDRVFGAIASGTFGAQLVALLVLLAAAIVFLLMLTGIWGIGIANFDIFIFFILLGFGCSFLVFIWALGFFLRFHRRVRRFLVGGGVGDVEADDPSTKTILALFAISVLFVLVAGIYGFYLLWKYFLVDLGATFLAYFGLTGVFFYEFGLFIVFLAVGVIFIALLMQLLTAAINRYAGRLVEGVSETNESK